MLVKSSWNGEHSQSHWGPLHNVHMPYSPSFLDYTAQGPLLWDLSLKNPTPSFTDTWGKLTRHFQHSLSDSYIKDHKKETEECFKCSGHSKPYLTMGRHRELTKQKSRAVVPILPIRKTTQLVTADIKQLDTLKKMLQITMWI